MISQLCASFTALSSVISHCSDATPCAMISSKAFLTEESFRDAKSFETNEDTDWSAPFGFVRLEESVDAPGLVHFLFRMFTVASGNIGRFYGRQQWAISPVAKIKVQIIGNATTPLPSPFAQTFTQPSCKFMGVFTYDLILHSPVPWI